MGIKILFIYPTPFRTTGLPAGLASLSAVLKAEGYDIKIFDTAFYQDKEQKSQTEIRSERMVSKTVCNEEQYLPANENKLEGDLFDIISEFQPDIIGVSILEIMFEKSVEMARMIKHNSKESLIVAGGVFATLSPEIVLEESSFDMVCIGEGESTLVELCQKVADKENYSGVDGLWIRSGEKIIKNKSRELHDINTLPHPDYSEFDTRLFYKPMQGEMYKMVNIESSRGCMYSCTYCGAPALRKYFRENKSGRYFRNMKIEKVISQIRHQVEKHAPEFLYFSSESFLSIKDNDFNYFINEYKKIQIPFWIQTRMETLTKDRLLKLRDVGMHWLSIGLEHGNEKFRKEVLKRKYSNTAFKKKMAILETIEMGASVNNIIGFPFENRGLVFDTINLNRQLLQRNPKLEINMFVFTPYKGCSLFDLCNTEGLLADSYSISSSTLSSESILNFPEEFKRDLIGLIRTFNLYVRMPEEYYDKIRIAEQPDKAGDLMLNELKKIQADVNH